ncbi:uncharacterized protein [Littorina saxatilis]|uniref:uncharacterized protein n=1 Tax=Littorina saxatilis TaxID=31220 RepID=UPI0038B6A886
MADASCQSDDDDDIIYIGTEMSSVSKTLPSARPQIKQEPGTFAENVDINMSTKHVPLPVHEFQDCVSGVGQAKSLRQLSSEGYYRCSGFDCRCMFRTLIPNALEKHLTQDHPSDNTYTCVHCGSAEMGQGNFLHHLEQHLSPQSHSLYCSDVNCNFSASSPESVISHMGTCHPAHINHVCWLCNDKFNSLHEFANHVKRNLLIIASCPRCSAKDVHEKKILSHVEFSHPDHSRRVDFHKILLCQDRKMSRWHLQNVTPANGNNIQPSAYIEHISSGSVSQSGIQRQVSILAARTVGESSSTSAHPEDEIQPHRQANDASQQQAVSDMQQPVLGDKPGPSAEDHSRQSARATTRKRVTFACDVGGDGQPSSDENNADSDDCIHWVRSVGSLTANSLDRNCQQLPVNGTSAPGPSTTSTDTTVIFKDPLLYYCKLCDHSGYSLGRMRTHIYKRHKEKMKCPKCDDYVPVNDSSFKSHLSEYHEEVNEALYWQNYSRRWIANEAPDRTMLDQSQPKQHQNNDSMPVTTRPKKRKKPFKGATYTKWK